MNKIYKVVWNTVRNCYVVGSELISSKSGRHSTSNGKSSSLKVTLTVLALCGMTALGSGVAPAYAADAGAAVESQYVAVLVNKNNNYYTSWGRQVQYGDTRTFNGHSYHKETVSGETYWVRDGYTIKYEENERYPGALKDNIIKAYKATSYTANSDAGLLKSNQVMVESAGISTLTGVDLDDVSGGTYVGATNSGSTSTPSSFNYMIKDDNGRYVDAGNDNFGERFKVATKHKDGTYSYKGEVIANDNLYVVDNKVGVFLTSSGKVYTGKVFGANNEVLMTTKSDSGTMYSYWGADTPDPNTKLADMTIGQFNQALEKVNNNSKAVAGDTIKEIKTTAKTDGGGTIDLVRRGQYNSATGQYEGEHKVGSGITITSHGGTNGEDVKINFSNGTTGFDVAAGSKVEAVGTKEATTGLTINGETYKIKTGQNYTAGDNITITGTKISAKNNYVNGGSVNKYDELVLTREGLEDLTVDLSRLTRGLSSTDYQLVANKNRSDGKYTVRNGEVTLTVKDMNNLSNKEKPITISGLAGKEDLTHYFSVDAPPDPLPGSSQIGNYDNEGAQGERSIAIGVKASATGDFSVAIGSGQNDAGSTASGNYATAVGNGSLAKGADSTALGYNATALGEDSVAIGYTSIANGKNSMALGVEARAGNNGSQADYATAVGALAHVDAVDGTALGQNAEVDSERGTALGSTSKVHAVKGTAIGAYTSVTAEGGVAIGQESVANRAAGMKGYAPVGEAGTSPVWKATDGAVSLGSDSDGSSPHTRQITNLAAGTADTDAVNVAQLKRARVELTNGIHTTVNSTNDKNDGHVIYSVDVNTNGTINPGDTNIVTGNTVYNALQNVSWTANVNGQAAKTVKKDGTLNFVNGDNISISNEKGDIKISTTGLASSGDLWTARVGTTDVRPVDKTVNFAGSDHITVTGSNGQIKFEATGLADTGLNNITEDGKTIINNFAKEAVKVVEGTNTTVTEGLSEDGKTKTYAVNVDNAAIQAATDVTGEKGISVTSAVENGVKKYTVSAKLSNNFAIDQATGNIDLAPSISVGKTNPVTINGNTGEITGLSNKTTTAANFADGSGRAATEEQLKEVNSKATAAKTTVTAGKNIEVKGQSDENGSAYTVALADDVSLGNGAIQLKGSDGSISAKSGGAQLAFNSSGLTVSQAKNGLTNETRINGAEITVDGGIGNQTTIKGSTARIGNVLVNGGGGTATISGLTNQTTKYNGFANGSGRAATEEQLKEVAGKAGEAIETAGKGWNLTTNGKEASKTNIAPDGTVDFSSSNDNLLISNAGANLSFSLSDNLDLTNNKDKKGSVKVGENTALSNELLQVGTSSLTTSALMVGGLTYINSSGINANNRVISNVAAGTLDTDAVNVGQLKSAISGSQVSIDAGTGIIVEKTGNKYTIKTNIEGLSNDHGTVTVSTNKDSAPVTDSGASMPAHAKRMNLMLMADDLAEVPETTTLKGDTLYVKHSANSVKLITDEIANHEDAVTLNDGEKIDFVGGKNIKTFSEHGTDANGKNYDKITFSLKDDISVKSVTTDKVTINNGPTINSSGINMNNQKITNLKDGEIAEGSTDAVNGGQLYNTNQAVIANAENINSLSHSLNKLDSRINRVGAGAAALAALHPLDFDPDNKWDFAAGYGNYAGANAVAIGTYYRPNENTMFSIGGSFGGGENMINAGVSFKLGSGGSGITTSKTVMAKKIKEQDELLKAQDAKMKEQDEKIAKLEALVAQQGEMIQQALGKK